MTKPKIKLAAMAAIHANDPAFGSVRVVDAGTGEPITNVIAADATSGTVSRYAVENGHLVREGDAWKVVDEKRPIRLEEIAAPADMATMLAEETEAEG